MFEAYAPASIMINRDLQSVFSLGPIDRYLQILPGHPSHDVLAMAPAPLRTKLRSAIHKAIQKNLVASASVTRLAADTRGGPYRVEVRPLICNDEDMLVISFIDEDSASDAQRKSSSPANAVANVVLEQALELAGNELRDAIHDLEILGVQQHAVNQAALSVNREHVLTNERLVTSKKDLQSLNHELTSLNGQLQDSLERQKIISDDLQHILYSTDVATIFLDTDLTIRFFTPASRLLFSVIATDIGRPLDDLKSLASDSMLLADSKIVLRDPTPIEREIETQDGSWFNRKVLPYRTRTGDVEGVVITFTDITERKRVAKLLGEAKRRAEIATAAKSHFLAAASHDLRQPLQTLALVQDLLKRAVKEEGPRKLIGRLDQTLGAMSGMLNTLLEINQIEAGTVHPEFVAFPINDILLPLVEEFRFHAEAQKLMLRAVPSRMIVFSDPRLLEQMVRNLLGNAVKYTTEGKVLIGCRRHEQSLSVEIWDTGPGIAAQDLQSIFEEYHQLDDQSHDRSHGLGLGLSIVKRLGQLMNHHIDVRSTHGQGSGFLIEVPLPSNDLLVLEDFRATKVEKSAPHLTGAVLIIEDEPQVCELLDQLLSSEGHRTACAASGEAALEMVRKGKIVPDVILADYNLPNGMDGLRTSVKLRGVLQKTTPVIILTGDISTSTLHDVSHADCIVLNKPIKPDDISAVIQKVLADAKNRLAHKKITVPQPNTSGPIIFVVDDDGYVRQGIRQVLEDDGRTVEDFATCQAFLDAYRPGTEACLLIDAYLPLMNGIQLLEHLKEVGHSLPSIMITGHSDVPMAVHAMKAGATNFIEKPIGRVELLKGVRQALEESRDSNKIDIWHESAAKQVASLTSRQREIMTMVLAGHPSKIIASDLGISQRTVENHRASIMKKTGTRSLPALARLALAATWTSDSNPAVAEPAVVKRPRTVLAH